MIRKVERLLDLRPGELSRGVLLFLYLFLIISSYVLGKAARDALFLDQFTASQLPLADIAVAALVGFIVALYIRIGRAVSLPTLLAGSLVVFASNSLLFWWLSESYELPWLFPTIYIWMGMFGVLAPAQVWTLASSVLTTREAKRLFGLVGAGAITGWIAGGYLTRLVALRFGAEAMLLGMSLASMTCAALVVAIWRQSQQSRTTTVDQPLAEEGPRSLRESLALIRSSPYLRAIAIVICLSSFATAIVGWQFKAMSKAFFPETNQLAAFFGEFNFYAGLASLAAQLLLTSRVLKHFGLGLALFIVPVALALSSTAVLLVGTLAAAVGLKGSDQVLRYSIDKTTVELLYLPVPSGQKVQVKAFIDTVIWRLGDGLSGIAVLIGTTLFALSAAQMSAVVLVLLAGWVYAAAVVRRRYVTHLSDGIHRHRLDAERAAAPVLDKSTADVLAGQLSGSDPTEILYALSLFDLGHHQATHPAVRGLVKNPSAAVRQKAVSILAAAGDGSVINDVEHLLHDEDLAVRTEALLYLTRLAHIDPLERIERLGDFPDFSIRSAMVAFLARPGRTQNLEAANLIFGAMVDQTGPDSRRLRLEAARLAELLPVGFDDHLRKLLADRDPEVARPVVRAVGKLKRRLLVESLLSRLHEPALKDAVAEALAAFGERIVGTLGDHLTDPAVPIETRRELPDVLLRIGTRSAGAVLADNLLDADTRLRFRIISALNKLSQQATWQIDGETVEMLLMAEIMGHYRSYQIVGMLGGRLEGSDPVVQALKDSMTQEVERIFRLLKLQFPRYDLHSAFVGVQSDNRVVHDNALEFLESILGPQLRSLMLPLIDSESSVSERVERATRLLGTDVETHEQAVAALAVSEDPWLKSCAAYAIGSLGLASMAHVLDQWASADDPLLRETARQARDRLGSQSVPRVPPAHGGSISPAGDVGGKE
jgi:AAA family ATP:ADP antiporter